MRFTTKIFTAAGAALILATAPAPRARAATVPHASLAAVRSATLATTSLLATTTQDAKVDINVNEKQGGAWYTNPVWIAIGIIALVLIIALIAMAGRGRDTTVVK
ncbi:MAG TPA: hypothetical protein VFM23_06020 [Gemmatimonadales bacterium]|nr:hypothetical protein [Gemmatimonadales bacterium]